MDFTVVNISVKKEYHNKITDIFYQKELAIVSTYVSSMYRKNRNQPEKMTKHDDI